jgi:hypothetical protein
MNASRALASIWLMTALGASALPACAGPTYVVELYSGPRRSAESIAVLRVGGADDARLVVVDGERADVPIADDARLHVEVLPGEHRLGVISRANPDGPLQYVEFRAEPGKIYRVLFQASGARVYEVDSRSDALLRDVTLAERGELTPAAPSQPPPAEILPKKPEPPTVPMDPESAGAGETDDDEASEAPD